MLYLACSTLGQLWSGDTIIGNTQSYEMVAALGSIEELFLTYSTHLPIHILICLISGPCSSCLFGVSLFICQQRYSQDLMELWVGAVSESAGRDSDLA